MKYKKIILISSAIVIMIAASFFIGSTCSPYVLLGTESPAVMSRTEGGALPAQMNKDGDIQLTTQERMVIYSAHVSLEVPNIQDTLGKIRILSESRGGYVASSSRSTYGVQSGAEITIRLPKERFHAALQEIESYGKVLDENTSSEDITQQFIDLNARLNNLLKQEERLRAILDIATTVDDILKVENELARIRGEIEALQGQVNYLEGVTEMSLISILLTEPPPPFTPPATNWSKTLEVAILGFFTILRGMIVLVISLIPVAAICVPAYYVYKRRKYMK